MIALDDKSKEILISRLAGDAGTANEKMYEFAIHLHKELEAVDWKQSYDDDGKKITQTSILEELAKIPNMPSADAGALRQMKKAGEFIGKAYNDDTSNIVKVGYWTFHNIARAKFVKEDETRDILAKKELVDKIIDGEVLPGKVKAEIRRIKLVHEPGSLLELIQWYNTWSFSSPDPRFGADWPGRIPGQILINVLYHYFDNDKEINVLDPMSGGGSSNDACHFMNTHDKNVAATEFLGDGMSENYNVNFLGFDINPDSFNSIQTIEKIVNEQTVLEHRPRNIIEKNAVDDDWNVSNMDLVFMDPPYFNQVGEKYMDNAFTRSRDSFFDAITTMVKKSYAALNSGGMIAMIISPQTEKSIKFDEGEVCFDMPYQIMKIMEQEGFLYFNRIQVPLSTEQFGPQDVDRAKKDRYRLLGTARDLILMKKP